MCVCVAVCVWHFPPPPPPRQSYTLTRAALSQQPCGHEYSGGRAAALRAVRGALARGSPESTPCYLSIWALSAPARPEDPRRPAGRPPCPLCHSDWGGIQPTCESIRSRAHLCGVGSHGAAWQEPREPGAADPLLEQWEPTLIG